MILLYLENNIRWIFHPIQIYDTVLSGGDLQFSTAKGFNPEEIIIDGDGFVTPYPSAIRREEQSGQVLDTVNISVYSQTRWRW